MRSLIFVFILIFISCNTKNQQKDSVQEIKDSCDSTFDTTLIRYAKDFEAKSIDLDKSISSEFSQLLNAVDTHCIKKSKKFEFVFSAVLLKLYIHHLECCAQGYDLKDMKVGRAKLIIGEFERKAGFANRHVEFLNSFNIVPFVEERSYLANDSLLKSLLDDVPKKMDSIRNALDSL